MVRAPGVYDGISAHLVRRAGFRVAYLTGAGAVASGYGLPDIGLATATEMTDRAALVVEARALPVVADADTGHGNPMPVVRTVRAYERAGVAALQLDDQDFPKRCGHLADKSVVGADDFVRKLAAALDPEGQRHRRHRPDRCTRSPGTERDHHPGPAICRRGHALRRRRNVTPAAARPRSGVSNVREQAGTIRALDPAVRRNAPELTDQLAEKGWPALNCPFPMRLAERPAPDLRDEMFVGARRCSAFPKKLAVLVAVKQRPPRADPHDA